MLCTRQVACGTSFLSRQHDVIASFSFGAHAVYTEFFCQWNFLLFCYLFYRVCLFSDFILLRGAYRPLWTHLLSVTMSSPSQKHGSCGHIMAGFDSHNFCARCREKGKGSDPCISHNDCNACNSLTEEQRTQLSTPSYRLKKEKRDSKKTAETPKQDVSSSLIDPSSVTVVGVVDDQGIVKSPGSSSEKKKKASVDKPNPHTSKEPSADKPSKSLSKSHKSSQDAKIDQLDQKWAERFNRLEALLLAKSLEQPEPTFSTVKVTPTHSPPHSSVVSSKPFIKPSTDQHRPDNSKSSDLPGITQTVSKSTSKSTTGRVSTDQPDLAGTDSPISQQVPSRSSSVPARRQSTSSMDTQSDSDLSDRPPVELFVEEGELSEQDPDASTVDPDLTLSEEQNYRETMSGIRSFMGWGHIPEVDTAASKSEDNPFAGPKAQPTGKIAVSMPTDEWLCNKMGKLNLTLTEGYPSRSSEAGGLLKDQFVRAPKSQAKWYNFVPNRPSGDQDAKTVHTWSTDASKVNSTYSRIAKAAGIASTAPPSRQISQDNLRRWEKSAREASIICNQAAAFNRCLYKVQDSMQTHLKVVKSDLSKGKSSERVSQASDELQFLLNFNSSITQSMAKTLEHLTDFVFVTVANTTLTRRDAYLSHLKMGIKPDTLAALRTGPLHISTLFPDAVLKQAEQDIANFESKGQVQSGKKGRFHPYERQDKRSDYRKSDRPAWKNIGNNRGQKKSRGKASYYSSRPAKGQQSYK